VDGVVGENGAFYFHYDTVTKKMARKYFRTDAQRKQDRAKLKNIGQEILEKVPGCRISADQAFREADLAIDFCEDVPALPESEVLRIVEIFKANGAVAKISSIHVNGWFGNYDKLSMTRVFFKDIFHLDMETIKDSIIFSGDSPNDEPMFEFFPNSVGVANIRVFKDRLSHPPVWITRRDGGYGFAEMADYLM
jgi:hydroxymethylpyrimidine pyrophosphatase-like HAD family hydrolase